MARSSRRGRAVAAVVVGLVGSGGVFALFAASAPSAFADSSPYELYCPGTPVGNIALNNVVTTGTITPAAPASGATFNLTNYQSTVSPAELDRVRRRRPGELGDRGHGHAEGRRHRRHPGERRRPAPSPSTRPSRARCPPTGLSLTLPSTPGTVGPFTASGGAISLTVDPAISLALERVGEHAHPDVHAVPEQQRRHRHRRAVRPPAAKASPVIATTTVGRCDADHGHHGGHGAPTPTTAAPVTATTAAPVTAPLASTGPGPTCGSWP